MKIKFLGIGGAFVPHLGSSAAVVETGKGTFTLIDAGCSTYADLCRTQRIDLITHVLVTHLHDDHVGSLGSIINHRFHVSHSPVVLLYPEWLEGPILTLLQLQRTNHPVQNYLHLVCLTSRTGSIGATRIEAVNTSSMHQLNMPSAAYIFRSEGQTIAYSGDLGDANVLFAALGEEPKSSTQVFHDASFEEKSRGSHVVYTDLYPQLDAGWDIYAYHNDPRSKPAGCRLKLVAAFPEFAPEPRECT